MSYGASIYSHIYNPPITTAYLERRHAALEKEIENALQHGAMNKPNWCAGCHGSDANSVSDDR
jgi:hypothetical protein